MTSSLKCNANGSEVNLCPRSNCGRLCGVRLRSAVTAAYIIILRHSSGARLCLEPASSKLRASWENKSLCTRVSTTVLRRQLRL